MNRREVLKAGLAGALALAFPWKLPKPRPETFAEYANRTIPVAVEDMRQFMAENEARNIAAFYDALEASHWSIPGRGHAMPDFIPLS